MVGKVKTLNLIFVKSTLLVPVQSVTHEQLQKKKEKNFLKKQGAAVKAHTLNHTLKL